MKQRSSVLLACTLVGFLIPAAPRTAAPEEALWQELAPPVRHTGNSGAVYDPVGRRMLVVGPYPDHLWALSTEGELRWSAAALDGAPDANPHYSSAVLDSARHRILVVANLPDPPFQGYGQLVLWSLSLDPPRRWTLLPHGVRRFNRWGFSTIIDPIRDRLIVFGGYYQSSSTFVFATNEVLTYDFAADTGWAVLATAGTPPNPRGHHSAIYDPRRDRMLVSCGAQPDRDGSSALSLDETWELALSGTPTWRFLTPTTIALPARHDHSAVYDPDGDRMLIFGGSVAHSSFARNDLWSLPLDTPSAVSWQSLATAAERRWGHLAIMDAPGNRMLVHGEDWPHPSDVTTRYDLMAYDLGANPGWSLLAGGEQIQNRHNALSVYDARRDRMIVIGGSGNGVRYGDVWAYAPITTSWARLASDNPHGSLVSYRPTASYDSLRDRVLVLTDCPTPPCVSGIIALNLATHGWSTITPAGPPPGATDGHGTAFDARGDRWLIFGGSSPGPRGFTIRYNDVWALTFAGSPAWTHLTPTGTPPSPRAGAWTFLDAEQRRLLVCGGRDSVATRHDLWALSLEGSPAWTLIPATGGPAGLVHSVLFDPVRRRLVAFTETGEDYAGSTETWMLSFDGGSWAPLAPGSPPRAPTGGFALLHDSRRDAAWIFGGSTYFGVHTNDTWSLSFDRMTPVLVSLVACAVREGRVELRWHTSDPTLAGSVERRSPGGAWHFLAAVQPDGGGHLVYVDAAVEPGARYEYRLRYRAGGQVTWTDPIAIEVPARMGLALAGVHPNPVDRDLTVAFTLATAAPATLEIYDLLGRRVLVRALGPLGPGAHRLSLPRAALERPGVHWLVLRQGMNAVSGKFAILR